jgi:6,7-dimethyl-8-ribityllumazine synthase
VYHEAVTDALRRGAVEALVQAGALADRIVVIRVPGAFEVPFAARRAAETGQFDALVCLGCIIRGETPHFNYLASAVAHGIGTASQATGVPISFGVLTTDTYEEAVARAGDGNDNKGWEAAMAAVQLANVVRSLNRDNWDRRDHDE